MVRASIYNSDVAPEDRVKVPRLADRSARRVTSFSWSDFWSVMLPNIAPLRMFLGYGGCFER